MLRLYTGSDSLLGRNCEKCSSTQMRRTGNIWGRNGYEPVEGLPVSGRYGLQRRQNALMGVRRSADARLVLPPFVVNSYSL